MRRHALVVSLLTVACHVTRAPRLEPAPSQPREQPALIADARAVTANDEAAPETMQDAASTQLRSDASAGASVDRRCPPEMAVIERPQGAYCIDRWEASLERRRADGQREPWPPNMPVDGRASEMVAVSAPGRKPQGYISGEQAEQACANANKRLCSIDEWVRACRGPRRTTYPYGNERRPGACNDRTTSPPAHPVVRLFERFAAPGTDRATMWQPRWMNDPRLHELPDTVAPTGSHAECRNEYGVYDLVGNLHEWIADREGTFVGGFFMDTIRNGEGCSYRTSAHDARYHDYSTGFRCCADASAP